MKQFKDYMIKFIELKYNSNYTYNSEGWGFGHDWNSMFPKDVKVNMEVRDGVYTALCVMFEYKASFNEKGKDYQIEKVIKWLQEDKISEPPYLPKGALRNGTYLIYYFFKIQKYLTIKNEA